MGVSDIDADKLLKQIAENDYVLEELDDHSTTFKYLYDTAIKNYADKKQKYNELSQKEKMTNSDLKSEKKLLRNIQERRLKFDEIIKRENEQIVALEKEHDEMRKKYSESVNNYREKLLSVEDEFDRNMLQEKIREMIEFEKEIEIEITVVITHKKGLDQRMVELNEQLPSFEDLKQIKNQMFSGNKELQTNQKRVDNLNTIIKNLKSKLEELSI